MREFVAGTADREGEFDESGQDVTRIAVLGILIVPVGVSRAGGSTPRTNRNGLSHFDAPCQVPTETNSVGLRSTGQTITSRSVVTESQSGLEEARARGG